MCVLSHIITSACFHTANSKRMYYRYHRVKHIYRFQNLVPINTPLQLYPKVASDHKLEKSTASCTHMAAALIIEGLRARVD